MLLFANVFMNDNKLRPNAKIKIIAVVKILR